MYKIYAILQGEQVIDGYRILPWPAVVEPKVRIAHFMWCIKGAGGEAILVDTGFGDVHARNRNINGVGFLESQLSRLQVDARKVGKIVVTHLHIDHFTAFDLYRNATFYIQTKEFEFLNGPGRNFPQIRDLSPGAEELTRLTLKGRVRHLEGDKEVVPGIKVVLVGGHTPGSQLVVVKTEKGNAVICGDAVDSYRNLDEAIVAPGADLVQGLLALDKVKQLASSRDLVIPSHDLTVMYRYPNPVEGIAEIG